MVKYNHKFIYKILIRKISIVKSLKGVKNDTYYKNDKF